jgi:hypothetical protein
MKTWILGALALALTISGSAARACPIGSNEGDSRREGRRPPVIQPVSFDASELFERAQELETVAGAQERAAVVHDRDAETFANRARILRNQAALVSVADRSSIFAMADELAARAASARSQAFAARAQAAELRLQARAVRERAVQLVRQNNGGGGGWRRGPGRPATTTAETTI